MTIAFLKFLFRISLIALVTLILLEIAVRLTGYSTVYFYDPIYMPYAGNNQIPFVMKPNLQNVRAHGNIRIHTDHLGLRNLTPGIVYGEKAGKEFRIALMGDSITFGYGVRTEDTYAVKMEQMLDKAAPDCPVTVFNFGVSSYSVKEMAATLKLRAPAIQPDLLVTGIIYGDFDLSRTPGIDQLGYNTHGEASRFLNRYPHLKALLRELHSVYAIRDAILAIRSHSRKKADTKEVPASYKFLLEMKESADRYNIPHLILLLPSIEGDGSQFDAIKEELKKDGINYLDTSTISRQFTPDEFKASRFDFHPSMTVHHKIAEMLSQHLIEHHIPPGCPAHRSQ